MLKIGIVGTGYFGEIHIKVLLKLKKKFKIVGFFDINKQSYIVNIGKSEYEK